MLFFKILSVLVISTVLGLGGLFISDHWKDTEEKNRWEARYQTIKNNRITIKDNVHSTPFTEQINNLPQMTFERFINLYSVSPEKWKIDPVNRNSYYDANWAIPYYMTVENDMPIYYPIYWTNGEEMSKYYEWLEKVYLKGDSALNLQIRADYLKGLTEHIQNDLKENRRQAEAELEALEAQFKKDRENLKNTNTPIELTLAYNTSH